MRNAISFLVILMMCFPVCEAFAASSSVSPLSCGALRDDVCYLTRSELSRIDSDPKNFKAVFLARKEKFIYDLGPDFRGITEEGAAIAFAGIAAYELKAYRSEVTSRTPVPASRSLKDLMAVPALVCDEYVSLAMQLFYSAYPQSNASSLKINPVGWRRDSPVGNHAEFFVTGSGVPLLIDPDLGLIAKTTLYDALHHIAVSQNAVFVRTRRPGDAAAPLLPRVRNALTGGAYDSDFLIYSFLSRAKSQNSGPKYSYGWTDFTSSIAVGPSKRIWYTTGNGALWVVTEDGIERVEKGGISDIELAPRGGAIYSLSVSGMVYRYARPNRKTLVRNGGVDAIISTVDGKIFYLEEGRRLPAVGGEAILKSKIVNVGTGLSGFKVDPRSISNIKIWTYASRSLGQISREMRDVVWIGGKKNQQGFYVRTRSGGLWDVNENNGVAYLAGDVADVKLGVGGLTINVRRFDGTIWQGNIDPDGGMDRSPQAIKWSQLWPGRAFASMELRNGGTSLEATTFGGRHVVASASSF